MPGATALHVDDPRGVVDFAAVVQRLVDLGYEGSCSVEYFDIPEQGWALEDPRAWAVDLAARLRAL
jgi:sugar phosphate isomerase/epimerase